MTTRPWKIAAAGALVALLALAGGGCSDGTNVQYLPIGSHCSAPDDCGTTPYSCARGNYPNGYCQRDCLTDGDCPTDSVCAMHACRRKCSATADCRAAEGYVCRADGASSPVCELPGSPPDGGA